jgi:hypothetical protein
VPNPCHSAGFVNNPQHISLKMYDTSGKKIASTTNLDSGSNFTDTWIHWSRSPICQASPETLGSGLRAGCTRFVVRCPFA